jgi:serine phosphatase RsbU (regulator of sigma subunit)
MINKALVDPGEIGRYRLQWLAVCLVFFGLPLIIAAFGFGTYHQDKEARFRADRLAYLDRITAGLSRNVEPDAFFFHILRQADPGGLSESARYRRLRRMIPDFHRRFPGLLTVSVLDRNGQLMADLSTRGRPQRVLRMLHALIRGNSPDGREFSTSTLLQSFTGPWIDLERLAEGGPQLLESRAGVRDKWFFASVHDQGALFVHISHPPNLPFLCIQDRIRALRRHPPRHAGFGLINLQGQKPIPPSLALAIGHHQAHHTPHFFVAGKLLAVTSPHPHFRVWAATRFDLPRQTRMYRRGMVMGFSLLMGILSFLAYRRIVKEHKPILPIGPRLAGVFFFCGGLPLLLLLFLGNRFTRWQSEEQTQELHFHSRQFLETLDQHFPRMQAELEQELQRFFAHSAFSTPPEQEAFKAGVRGKPELFHRNLLRIFNPAGQVIWKFSGHPISFGDGDRLMGKVTARALGVLNLTPRTGSTGGTSALPPIPGTEEPEMQFLGALRRFITFSFAGDRNWIIAFPIAGASGKVSHIVVLNVLPQFQEAFFLQRLLPDRQKRFSPDRLVAVSRDFTTFFPAQVAREETFLRTLRRLSDSEGRIPEIFAGRHGTELVSAVFPRHFSRFFFVARQDLNQSLQDLSRYRLWLSAMGILVLTSAIFLGYRLSRAFLEPLHHLSRGMTALQQRRFDHRLADQSQDEFGQLARLFNRAFEDLSELHVAHAVQEMLLPPKALKVGPYAIFGVSHPCRETGGDFFDLRLCANGKVFFLIGDVSGHGISAALTMSVIKGIVDRRFADDTDDPENILTGLYQAVFPLFQTRKMATCLAGLLDPITHQLELVNAGHCYPLLGFPGEPAHEARLPSFPIGFRRKSFHRLSGKLLDPGQSMLLFTDFLFEGTRDREPIGYDTIAANAFRFLSGEAHESVARIIAWHAEMRRHTDPEDDLTVLLISRQPEESSTS